MAKKLEKLLGYAFLFLFISAIGVVAVIYVLCSLFAPSAVYIGSGGYFFWALAVLYETHKKAKESGPPADVEELDSRVVKSHQSEPKSRALSDSITPYPLPWCPVCKIAPLDQQGYVCGVCGKSVCRNCIVFSKRSAVCRACGGGKKS